MTEILNYTVVHATVNESGLTTAWNASLNGSYGSADEYGTTVEASVSQKVIMKMLAPIACSLGMCCAIVTLIALSQKKTPSTTNCYLTAMTGADLVFLLLLGTITILEEFDPVPMTLDNLQAHYAYEIYKAYGKVFLMTFLLAYEWTTAAMSFERCLVMCRPMVAQRYSTPAHARLVITIIFLLSFVVQTPRFAEFKLEKYKLSDSTITVLQTTDLDPTVTKVHRWIVDIVLMAILPLVVTIISNFFVIRQIHKSNTYLSSSLPPNNTSRAGVNREQRRVSLLLIAVGVAYVIGAAPYITCQALMVVVPRTQLISAQSVIMTTIDVAIFLITVRSIFIFASFCWFFENFQQTLRQLCPKRKKRVSGRRNNCGTGYELVHRQDSYKTRSTTIVLV